MTHLAIQEPLDGKNVAFYAGWLNAFSALPAVEGVFETRVDPQLPPNRGSKE